MWKNLLKCILIGISHLSIAIPKLPMALFNTSFITRNSRAVQATLPMGKGIVSTKSCRQMTTTFTLVMACSNSISLLMACPWWQDAVMRYLMMTHISGIPMITDSVQTLTKAIFTPGGL